MIKKTMTIDEALYEWKSCKRRMGCRAATDWFCDRVQGFFPERLARYNEHGERYDHVVCTDGTVRIDLAPYSDSDDCNDLSQYSNSGDCKREKRNG